MSDSPLRILHLTAASDAGGISRYLLDLCTAMRALGHDITIAGQRGAWHGRFEAAGFRWIEIPLKGGPLALWKSSQILRRFLAEHPVDLLHAHYRRATLLGRRLQHSRGIPPLLYTVHLSHMPMTIGRRWLSDFGDHTHVAAAQARQWLIDQKLIKTPNRITCIPHGVDPARFPIATNAQRISARLAFGIPHDATIAAYVGRLDYPKNEEWLLDLADRSRAKLPNFKLLIAGSGPHEAAVRETIRSRNLSDRVILLGECDPLPIYQAADAALLPSLREGFSYVNAEAMSVGVPVLRTNTAGTQEMIIENVTGRSTPIEREAFIAAAMDFLSDRNKLREMGHAAAEHVRQNLSFDRQLSQTLALYRRLAK
jgi:glycosyltransferase involved in cell wall biosynthesis